MMDDVLSLQQIRAGYGANTVLQDISLNVRRGEIVGLLGRNGAGKTTTVAVAAGFLPARSGRVQLVGDEVTALPSYRRSRAGLAIVPQGRRLFRSLTVRENLEVAQQPIQTGRFGWTVDMFFDRFPAMRRRASHAAGVLSGGEQQMVAIGRAMVSAPAVMLMDEPSEGLSPRIVRDLGRTLRNVRDDGGAILLIEQNIRFALETVDRLVVLSKGEALFSGTPTELKERPDIMARHLGVE